MLLLALVLLLGTLFFFRGLGSFYFAGFVADNLGHFHDDAVCIAQGSLPYSDAFRECVAVARKAPARTVVFEYPPATGLLLGLMGLASGADPMAFQMVFMGCMFLIMLLIFMIAYNEAEALRAAHGPDRRAHVFAATAATLLAVGPVALVSFDLIPAALTLGALLLALRRRSAAAGALLGLAVAFKGYPVVLLPLFAAIALKRGRAQGAAGAAGFASVLGAFTLAALLISPSGFAASFAYHSGRGLELNSVYAALLVLMKYFGVIELAKHFDHGSWNLTGGGVVRMFEAVSTLLLACALLLGAWRGWALFSQTKNTPESGGAAGRDMDAALRWAVGVLCLFMVFFKVGSPQFLCWIAPFIPLLVLRNGAWIWAVLFVLAGHAGAAVFPHQWAAYAGGLRAAPAAMLLFGKWALLVLGISVLSRNRSLDSGPGGVRP